MAQEESKQTECQDLITRLKHYNAWRRGAEIEMPSPDKLGKDIDAVILILDEMVKEPTPHEIYTTALRQYGHAAQTDKMIEECSELITALLHHRISRAKDDEVCEELADVEIMLAQMRIIFGPKNVERMKQKKISRLAEMIGLQTAISG